eukprot:CAMPEP_0196721032 /NCGR_PEP_ID=MMETSP1091-20130531/3698_1 /TAXON_ID=302021 /ORGANISM="Rhodomonas sp., Strain CCMP768" /LENGTH=117 /DNA_ID=CAMNT_0042062407 /DNA_START=226 /DNA_END=580 /DNA_ORIENTATION=-
MTAAVVTAPIGSLWAVEPLGLRVRACPTQRVLPDTAQIKTHDQDGRLLVLVSGKRVTRRAGAASHVCHHEAQFPSQTRTVTQAFKHRHRRVGSAEIQRSHLEISGLGAKLLTSQTRG